MGPPSPEQMRIRPGGRLQDHHRQAQRGLSVLQRPLCHRRRQSLRCATRDLRSPNMNLARFGPVPSPFTPRLMIFGVGDSSYPRSKQSFGLNVADAYAQSRRLRWAPHHPSRCEFALEDDSKIIIAKPNVAYQFSNGHSAIAAASLFAVPPERIIFVHGNIDRELGSIMFRFGGTHDSDGIDSITSEFHTERFWRLSVGIADPHQEDPAPLFNKKGSELDQYYRRMPFAPRHMKLVEKVKIEAVDSLEWLIQDIQKKTEEFVELSACESDIKSHEEYAENADSLCQAFSKTTHVLNKRRADNFKFMSVLSRKI
eukprot:TRINITY_DN3745_c0_g1_i1.p1 TRINITY_DN3745_c0_g1~~TRINITY_DN3745_c0_g1_i1.p1  ORF type:complete len:313 (-),score=97.07 TRINITY_DN3745_c0_g1_i1:62-1000(-)